MGAVDILLQSLQQARKDATAEGLVTVSLELFDQIPVQLTTLQQQLEEAESAKPSVVGRLNKTIQKLEAEISELRSLHKVTDLEKKVQRLELELKNSYASKNFTLKNGLLEIEKQYREYIDATPEAQDMWHEITTLTNEESKDGIASFIPRTMLHSSSMRMRTSKSSRTMAKAAAEALKSVDGSVTPCSEADPTDSSQVSSAPSLTGVNPTSVAQLTERVVEQLEVLRHEGVDAETFGSHAHTTPVHIPVPQHLHEQEEEGTPGTPPSVPKLKVHMEEKLGLLGREGIEGPSPTHSYTASPRSSSHTQPHVITGGPEDEEREEPADVDSMANRRLESAPTFSLPVLVDTLERKLDSLQQQGVEGEAAVPQHRLPSSSPVTRGEANSGASAAMEAHVQEISRSVSELKDMFKAVDASGTSGLADPGAMGQQLDALVDSVNSLRQMRDAVASPEAQDATDAFNAQTEVLLASISQLRGSYLAHVAAHGGVHDSKGGQGPTQEGATRAATDAEVQRELELLLNSVADLRLLFGKGGQDENMSRGERVWRTGGHWWPGSGSQGHTVDLSTSDTDPEPRRDGPVAGDVSSLTALFGAFMNQAESNGAYPRGRRWQLHSGAQGGEPGTSMGQVEGLEGDSVHPGQPSGIPSVDDLIAMFQEFLMSNEDGVRAVLRHLGARAVATGLVQAYSPSQQHAEDDAPVQFQPSLHSEPGASSVPSTTQSPGQITSSPPASESGASSLVGTAGQTSASFASSHAAAVHAKASPLADPSAWDTPSSPDQSEGLGGYHSASAGALGPVASAATDYKPNGGVAQPGHGGQQDEVSGAASIPTAGRNATAVQASIGNADRAGEGVSAGSTTGMGTFQPSLVAGPPRAADGAPNVVGGDRQQVSMSQPSASAAPGGDVDGSAAGIYTGSSPRPGSVPPQHDSTVAPADKAEHSTGQHAGSLEGRSAVDIVANVGGAARDLEPPQGSTTGVNGAMHSLDDVYSSPHRTSGQEAGPAVAESFTAASTAQHGENREPERMQAEPTRTAREALPGSVLAAPGGSAAVDVQASVRSSPAAAGSADVPKEETARNVGAGSGPSGRPPAGPAGNKTLQSIGGRPQSDEWDTIQLSAEQVETPELVGAVPSIDGRSAQLSTGPDEVAEAADGSPILDGHSSDSSNWNLVTSQGGEVQVSSTSRQERHSAPEGIVTHRLAPGPSPRSSRLGGGAAALPRTGSHNVGPSDAWGNTSRALQHSSTFSHSGGAAEAPSASSLLAAYNLQATHSGRLNLKAVAHSIMAITRKYPTVLSKAPEADALLGELSLLVETLVASHNALRAGGTPPSVSPRTTTESQETPFAVSAPSSISDGPSTDSLPPGASIGVDDAQGTHAANSDGHHLETDINELRQMNQDLASRVRQYELALRQMESHVKQAVAAAAADAESQEVTSIIADAVFSQQELLDSCTEAAKKVDEELVALQAENDYLTRSLIDAKLDLANTKGEYLELLRGVRKVLTRESTTMGRLAELERMLALVAPGEAAILTSDSGEAPGQQLLAEYFSSDGAAGAASREGSVSVPPTSKQAHH